MRVATAEKAGMLHGVPANRTKSHMSTRSANPRLPRNTCLADLHSSQHKRQRSERTLARHSSICQGVIERCMCRKARQHASLKHGRRTSDAAAAGRPASASLVKATCHAPTLHSSQRTGIHTGRKEARTIAFKGLQLSLPVGQPAGRPAKEGPRQCSRRYQLCALSGCALRGARW